MSRRHIFTVVLLIACCCVIYLSESLSSHGFWLRLRTKFRSSDHDSSDSVTSGQLFKGIKVRKFPRSASRYSKLTRSEIESLTRQKRPLFIKHAKLKACNKWVVITTIFAPSDSVRKASQLDGWCVVVVADKKGPSSYDVENVVYLSVRDQEELANYYSFVRRLPWNHFGRKNIGYLYAIFQGAQYIFDMDDDNVLKQLSISRPKNVMKVSVVNCTAFNIYPPMEATEHPSWPRGFPLDQIKQDCAWSSKLHELDEKESIIFQSLADHDPDVDAIYRMTQSLPFYFKGHTSFSIPPGVFVPYNAQASLHHRKSFWGLLLPITVHSRVSDIWRSYFTQRLLWEIGSRLAFVPPWVNQFRNPHNYLRDFQAETDLYLKTSSLIEFLVEWKGNSTTFPGRLEELWIELYERSYIEKQDVELLQAWLDALIQVGYAFPNITNVHFFHKNFKQHSHVEKRSQRIFVTGINGLIGSHVAKELVKNPHYEVYGLIRQRSNLATLTNILHKIKLVHGDITDTYRMKQIIEQIRPHIIMHFAAQAINSISYDTPQLTIDTNIRGTLNLLEAVRQTGLLNTRFLFAGSSTEYGRTADLLNRSISENDPLKPVSPYGVSKVAAELLALQYYYSFGLPVIIARFFIQVGVGGTDSLAMHDFSRQVAMIEHGLLPPILRHGNIESKRDMSDIRLVAPIVVKLAEKGVGGEVYNVGTGNGVSMKDVLFEILSQSRVNISVEEEESRLRVYDERYLSADISKLKALTGYEPQFDLKSIVDVVLNYWRREVMDLRPSVRAAIVTIYSERRRYLLRTLPTWNRCLPWMHKKYPVIVFISDIVNDTEQRHIRTLAGNLQIRFVVFQYGWNQTRDRSGGGGGPWVNWLLTKEMYEFPELRNLEYMMRLDEDIFFYNISYFDIFQDMKDNNILVGWKQWIFGNDVAIGSGLPDRVVKYNSLWSESRGYNLSDVWSKVTDPLSSHHTLPAIQSYPKARDSLWRPYLVAGCVEMYATSIFRTPHYHKWLSDLRIADGLSQSHYWEQEVKTLWLHTYVPLANWKTYACALPLYHQDQRPESISHWFFDDCDYITGRPLSITRCDIDAELRIC